MEEDEWGEKFAWAMLAITAGSLVVTVVGAVLLGNSPIYGVVVVLVVIALITLGSSVPFCSKEDIRKLLTHQCPSTRKEEEDYIPLLMLPIVPIAGLAASVGVGWLSEYIKSSTLLAIAGVLIFIYVFVMFGIMMSIDDACSECHKGR